MEIDEEMERRIKRDVALYRFGCKYGELVPILRLQVAVIADIAIKILTKYGGRCE